jgi:hypothetical protein
LTHVLEWVFRFLAETHANLLAQYNSWMYTAFLCVVALL